MGHTLHKRVLGLLMLAASILSLRPTQPMPCAAGAGKSGGIPEREALSITPCFLS